MENINLNLLGDASIVSANYEKLFQSGSFFLITGKVGLGYNREFQLCVFGPCPAPHDYITVPHHITGIFGRGRHFAEMGLGGTLILGPTRQHYLFYLTVGYRLQPLRSNKVNVRIFVQIPFIGLNTEDIIFAPFGVSVGWCFSSTQKI
jgi:hypothetical protein